MEGASPSPGWESRPGGSVRRVALTKTRDPYPWVSPPKQASGSWRKVFLPSLLSRKKARKGQSSLWTFPLQKYEFVKVSLMKWIINFKNLLISAFPLFGIYPGVGGGGWNLPDRTAKLNEFQGVKEEKEGKWNCKWNIYTYGHNVDTAITCSTLPDFANIKMMETFGKVFLTVCRHEFNYKTITCFI